MIRLAALLAAGALLGGAEPRGASEPRSDRELRCAGVIGQSQPQAPLPWLEAAGVACDADGMLWVAAGDGLTAFPPAATGLPTAVRRIVLGARPTALRAGRDGRLVVADQTGRVLAVDPGAEDGRPVELGRVPPRAPLAVDGDGRVLVIDGGRVLRLDSGRLAPLLDLPALPAEARCSYTALAVDPRDGALVVASGWPDRTLRRFDATGTEVRTAGWPVGDFAADQLIDQDGDLWVLGGGRILRLEADQAAGRREAGLAVPGGPYASGLAHDAFGTWWVSGSQGVLAVAPTGGARGRLGGLGAVLALAAAADGTLLALAADGNRLLRLDAAGEPGDVLPCAANEPWRVGRGWSGRAAGLAWDGERFLVADAAAGRLWRFDPWRTGQRERTWTPIGAAGSLAPRALAATSQRLWLLDGDRLLGAASGDPADRRPLTPPDGLAPSALHGLAGGVDGILALATIDAVLAAEQRGNALAVRWRRPAAGVRQLAAGAAAVAAITADGLTVWRSADGEPLVIPAAQRPQRPTAVAVWRSWLLVADQAVAGVRRYRLPAGPAASADRRDARSFTPQESATP